MGNKSTKSSSSHESGDDFDETISSANARINLPTVPVKLTIREEYAQKYQKNLDAMKVLISTNTLSAEMCEGYAKDTLKIINDIPDEFRSQKMREMFLKKKDSFEYIKKESMTAVYVMEFYKKLICQFIKNPMNLNRIRSYDAVIENIFTNIKYFPNQVYTEQFVNFVFDTMNRYLRASLKDTASKDYIKDKTECEYGLVEIKKKFVKRIPDGAMNQMLGRCIIAENQQLRSSIKPELLALYDL
jgi:hypothetical protein